MELPKDVEEILSDDYEEGEILDEDTLYEEVSSLEEFSGGEFDSSQTDKTNIENDSVESASEKKLKQHTKHHRKKEHKCKEDSICRKERKGKHCYARIRKEKQPPVAKSKNLETSEPFNDKNASKRTEVCSVVKRIQKIMQGSPNRLRQESNKTYKLVEKDYHEKENRHTNKKHWPNNEKLSKSKTKHLEKHAHNRSKIKDHSKTRHSNSSILGSHHSDLDCNIENQTFSKTSLLKRLVGSGNTGVKTLKDNENVVLNNQTENLSTGKPTDTSCPSESDLPNDSTQSNSVTGESNTVSVEDNSTANTAAINVDAEVLEVQTKKIELKWKRSMKEDKDELHLRVEALKSAWVKKFNDRKKKGLIQQKKSELIDDSLVDFVLDSDSDEANAPDTFPTDQLNQGDTKNNCTNSIKFSVTDLSGDILKPEDMIIDKSSDTPIICEPALQIVTSSDSTNPVSDSSVFIASSSTLFSVSQATESTLNLPDRALDRGVQIVHPSEDIDSYSARRKSSKDSRQNQTQSIHSKASNDLKHYKHLTPKSSRDRRSLSRSISRSERKSIAKFRKKIRRKARRDSLKNTVQTLELDDETALREQALLSLKSKSNRIPASQNTENEHLKINNESHVNQIGTNGVSVGNPLPSNLLVKKLTHLGESEGTGATSSDNWEDDLDEDILRAQLLSSLTKQVSGNSTKAAQPVDDVSARPSINIQLNSNLKPQNVRKIIIRKQDRRRLKSINKKIWKQNKQNLIAASEQKMKLDERKNRLKRFGKGNVFIKSDTLKVPISSQSNIAPPIPQVPKLIISVDDSDSSTDNEVENEELPQEPAKLSTYHADIEANIDLLLREAKRNTQLEKLAADPMNLVYTAVGTCPNNDKLDNFDTIQEPVDGDKKPEGLTSQLEVNQSAQVMREPVRLSTLSVLERRVDSKPKIQSPLSISSSSGSSDTSATPQALKHLPAWQQEEYRRLKKKIAEKEKVLQITRSKVLEPLEITGSTGSPTAHNESDEGCGQPEQNPLKPVDTVPENNVEVNTDISEKSLVKIPNKVEKPNHPLDMNSNSKNTKSLTNYSSDDGTSNNEKKKYSTLASCSIMEEINVMNDIVNDFNKNSSEYSDLKTKWTRLKKALKITETKMALKQKKLLLVKENIQEKDRVISSKIASIAMTQPPSTEKNKAPTRDMELIKLKYKEVSLRAQFLFHDFSTELNNEDKSATKAPLKDSQSTILKDGNLKLSTSLLNRKRVVPDHKQVEKAKEMSEPPKKRSFSAKEREREEWDPNTPVCHFDLNGICKDEECKYQHFKTV